MPPEAINDNDHPEMENIVKSETKSKKPEIDQECQNGEKQKTNNNNATTTNGHRYNDSQWNEQNEKLLMGPYDYMSQHPGKDIRRQLINAFNEWLKVPPESLVIITKVVGMLHTASLL